MSMDCAICWGNFDPTRRFIYGHCREKVAHYFDLSCIGEWLRQSPCCPICRSSLTINDVRQIQNPRFSLLQHGWKLVKDMTPAMNQVARIGLKSIFPASFSLACGLVVKHLAPELFSGILNGATALGVTMAFTQSVAIYNRLKIGLLDPETIEQVSLISNAGVVLYMSFSEMTSAAEASGVIMGVTLLSSGVTLLYDRMRMTFVDEEIRGLRAAERLQNRYILDHVDSKSALIIGSTAFGALGFQSMKNSSVAATIVAIPMYTVAGAIATYATLALSQLMVFIKR